MKWEYLAMCDIKTEKDKISDKLFLLYLINSVNKQNNFLGITKLQKLVYILENYLYTKGKRALNFSFFRWDYGPMSKEIYVERDFLVNNGLIEKEGDIRITKKGKNLLSQCSEILEENETIIQLIDRITNEYSRYETEDLKNRVYNTKDPSWGLRIIDISQGFDLLVGLPEKEDITNIDSDWIETLDILLDAKAYISIIESTDDAKVNKSIRFEDLLAV